MSVNDLMNSVYNAIEDCVFETHKLCSLKEIEERLEQRPHVIKKALDFLIKQDKVYVAYSRQGVPNLYIPKYMMNQILLTQNKPDWMSEYYFKERNELETKISKQSEELLEFEIFERLLYATGEPLEDAVAYSLKWLKANKVHHYKTGDKDIQDIDFEIDNIKYLVEVKGKTKQADKDDVEELNGWRKQEILKKENDDKKLDCLLIVNHFRKINPRNREESLTLPAKKWLMMYGLKVVTTVSIFNLITEVKKGRITKKHAIETIVQGQNIN